MGRDSRNIKKKVLVCGTRFGQFYIEAILNSSQFKLAGIFARGSEKSIACSKCYGVDFYHCIEDLPNDIDIACVAVKTGVMGGQGTMIAQQLMERGIDVITEQPIHYQEMIQCCKSAQQRGVSFHIGNLYEHLPAVQKFISVAAQIMKSQKPLYVNVDMATQVSYPLAAVLTKLFPRKRSWKVKDKMTESGPFSMILLEIGDIPASVRAQNQVDTAAADNYMHLFFNISIGFDSGSLTLTDIHGAVIWRERMNIPERMWIPGDLHNNAPVRMQNENNHILYSDDKSSYQTILTRVWPQAICRDIEQLSGWSDTSQNKKAANAHNTLVLQAASNWQVLTQAFGYPKVCERLDQEYFDIEEVVTAKYKEMSLAKRYQTLTADEIERCVATMDRACLLSILAEFQSRGLFLSGRRSYNESEIVGKMAVQPKNQFIIRRWLAALIRSTMLETTNNRYFSATRISAQDNVWEMWKKAGVLWNDILGPTRVWDYFYQNACNLRGLLEGTVSANYLLFPAGKNDIADSLYRETLIAWYMNQTIADKICSHLAGKKAVRILETGAGTGATTDVIINELAQKELESKLTAYEFTDLSTYFLSEAAKKYGVKEYFKTAVLNLEQEAGWDKIPLQTYDIIVAAGVLNNVKNTDLCLSLMWQKLKEDGIILISEATEESLQILISQVFMMEEAKDARQERDSTFMSQAQWEAAFARADFKILQCVPGADDKLSCLGQRVFILRKDN